MATAQTADERVVAPPAPGRPRRGGRRRLTRHRGWLVPLALIAPALILRGFTALWPFIDTIRLSFYRSSPLQGADKWIGLANYRHLLGDPDIRQSLAFTAIYSVASTLIELVLGLAIAVLLNQSLRLGRLLRPLALAAWGMPVVVAATAFRFGLDPQFGIFADAVHRVTGLNVSWLLEFWPARISVIMTNVWRNAPFVAILLLAALQEIPHELQEAARVDGAGSRQVFRRITLPLLTPTICAVATFFVIFQAGTFDVVLAMTGGGPGTATQVLGYTAYVDAFQNLNFGEAACMSVLLFLLVLVAAIGGSVLRRRAEARIS